MTSGRGIPEKGLRRRLSGIPSQGDKAPSSMETNHRVICRIVPRPPQGLQHFL